MSATTSRRSLAADFAPATTDSRSARLVGALPPRLPTEPPDCPVPPAAAIQETLPAAASPANQGSPDDVVRSVAVYLPPPLLARLREVARAEDLTYADVLCRAASNHIDTIASRFSRPAAPTTGMPTRIRAARPASPGVQTQLRLDGHQITWLDEAARQVGAPSRTALVVALLDEDLV